MPHMYAMELCVMMITLCNDYTVNSVKKIVIRVYMARGIVAYKLCVTIDELFSSLILIKDNCKLYWMKIKN